MNTSLQERRPPSRRRSGRLRRGSIYLLTLSTALIISVLALAALTNVRIQRRQTENGNDSRTAQLYAKAALDMAFYRIRTDANWRSKMASGTWSTDLPIGDGYYSFTGSDPTDGNLTDSAYDPVVIVGTGKSGGATQKLQMQINVLQPGIRCLEPSVHADHNLVFDGVTITSDHIVGSNNDVEVKNGGKVYADVEAANNIKVSSGGTYYGSTSTAGNWPRQMPNTATLYDYYTFRGTTINYNDLPAWDANLLDNPGAESGLSPWYDVGCSLYWSTQSKSGARSILVYNRNATSDTVAQNVTAKLQSGITYYSEVQMKFSDGSANSRIVLKLVSTGGGTQYVPLSAWKNVNDKWTKLSGTATVSWTGVLSSAEWYLETQDDEESFRIDDAILKDNNAPGGWKVIHRQVLSPSNNPFGAGVTNAQGIYVLDCGGGKISIRDSRIVGTLILKNQEEANSNIGGSIHWAPAVLSADPSVANLPAILTNKKLRLYLNATALDEGQGNVNFNPSGTPYHGSSDSDKTDVYPSRMEGVIYTEKNIEMLNSPTIVGVLVGDDDIDVKATTLTVQYNPLYFEVNAPPGFQAAVSYRIVPNSFRQVVD